VVFIKIRASLAVRPAGQEETIQAENRPNPPLLSGRAGTTLSMMGTLATF
jgi:hypothetical protein